MKTLTLKAGELRADEYGDWHGILIIENNPYHVTGSLTYCMNQFRMYGRNFLIRTPNRPVDPGQKETDMDCIKLDEETIREAFNKLKARARSDWKPKGFFPMDDYQWYIEIKGGTATMFVTFTIVDKGKQVVHQVLSPKIKTETKEPASE